MIFAINTKGKKINGMIVGGMIKESFFLRWENLRISS